VASFKPRPHTVEEGDSGVRWSHGAGGARGPVGPRGQCGHVQSVGGESRVYHCDSARRLTQSGLSDTHNSIRRSVPDGIGPLACAR
jgi:hypothetical protein